MDKRIEKELGEKAHYITYVSPDWFGIDQKWSAEFREHVEVKMIGRDSAIIRIIDDKLDNLTGMKFEIVSRSAAGNKTAYSFNELKEGVKFKPRSGKLFLTVDSTDYTNPYFCKCSYSNRMSLMFLIDQ
jgi:hypothetical protein